MFIPTVSIIILMFFMFWIIYMNRSTEKTWWNDGKCPKCGQPWVWFDTDSQGGRGYKCNNCNKCIWISYKNIDAGYVSPQKDNSSAEKKKRGRKPKNKQTE